MSTFYNPNQVLYNVYDNTNKALQVEVVGAPLTLSTSELNIGQVNVLDTTDTEINPAITSTYGSPFPASGTPAGFTDGTNMRAAFVAAFHNSDFQVPMSGQYGILSGGVAQIYDPGGFLDRQRGTGADGIPAVGVATGAQQMAGPGLTTTFGANVTGNATAQSVQVASSASAKVGDVMLTQDNPEYVTVTAIVDGTHVTGIFKNNHTSGQTLTWYHYNQARDATAGDSIALTGMSANVNYLVNNITSTAEQERSAKGELDGASGQGTAIAAEYEWNGGGPYNGTTPSALQFDRGRTVQAKGLGAGSISNNPLSVGSTSLTLNSAPTTLMAGQYILLDRAGANPEGNYVGSGYTAGSTTVPLQNATAFSHAQNSTVEWDQYSALGPALNGFLASGMGVEEDVVFNPVDNKFYIERSHTQDGIALANVISEGLVGYNGTNGDRWRMNTTGALIAAGTTTTQTAIALTTYNANKLVLAANITAGAGNITVAISASTSSGYTYPLLTSTALSGNGTTPLRIGPGLTPSANSVANDVVPRNIVVTVTVSGSITYGVDYLLGV